MKTLQAHWPEYLIEAGCLGGFLLSAAACATMLRHPVSPLASAIHQLGMTPLGRLPMGVAMGLTAMAIIYSPAGRRSGAHMNPAVTLTFWRLGKMQAGDAIAYMVAQFAGGLVGIAVATVLLGGLPAHPTVNYVATQPGPAGPLAAFAAEAAISFGMMTLVLQISNRQRLAPLTGVCVGVLVALYITFEDPLSGMSMNPARSFGPALLAHTGGSLWIYFTAPPLGMLLAADAYVRARGRASVRCAKLHHPASGPCIFRCGFMEQSA